MAYDAIQFNIIQLHAIWCSRIKNLCNVTQCNIQKHQIRFVTKQNITVQCSMIQYDPIWYRNTIQYDTMWLRNYTILKIWSYTIQYDINRYRYEYRYRCVYYMMWCDTMWHDMKQYDTILQKIQCYKERYDMMRHNMKKLQYNMIWYDTRQFDRRQFDTIVHWCRL